MHSCAVPSVSNPTKPQRVSQGDGWIHRWSYGCSPETPASQDPVAVATRRPRQEMIQNLKEIDLGSEVAMAGPSNGLIKRVAGKYGIRME